jgi:hypothetical protein
MTTKGKDKKNSQAAPAQEKQAPTENSATPDRSGWKPFGKLRIPAHWEDVTPKKSGTMVGIVGSPFKPKR